MFQLTRFIVGDAAARRCAPSGTFRNAVPARTVRNAPREREAQPLASVPPTDPLLRPNARCSRSATHWRPSCPALLPRARRATAIARRTNSGGHKQRGLPAEPRVSSPLAPLTARNALAYMAMDRTPNVQQLHQTKVPHQQLLPSRPARSTWFYAYESTTHKCHHNGVITSKREC